MSGTRSTRKLQHGQHFAQTRQETFARSEPWIHHELSSHLFLSGSHLSRIVFLPKKICFKTKLAFLACIGVGYKSRNRIAPCPGQNVQKQCLVSSANRCAFVPCFSLAFVWIFENFLHRTIRLTNGENALGLSHFQCLGNSPG